MDVNFDEQPPMGEEGDGLLRIQQQVMAQIAEASGNRMAQDFLDHANKDKDWTLAEAGKVTDFLNSLKWPVWMQIYVLSSCLAQQISQNPPGKGLPDSLQIVARTSAVMALLSSMVADYVEEDRQAAKTTK